MNQRIKSEPHPEYEIVPISCHQTGLWYTLQWGACVLSIPRDGDIPQLTIDGEEVDVLEKTKQYLAKRGLFNQDPLQYVHEYIAVEILCRTEYTGKP